MAGKTDISRIQAYIEGSLDELDAAVVKEEIQKSKELFNIYVELKEADFLIKKGKKASKTLENRVLKMVRQNSIPHYKYILRMLKDEIIVISGDQEKLGFTGVKANFAYRSETVTESVIINRQIDGHKLSIVVTPTESAKEFSIAVVFENNDAFDVSLMKNSAEIERIKDTSVQKMFASRIGGDSDIDLVFRKDGAVLFTVSLQLQSE